MNRCLIIGLLSLVLPAVTISLQAETMEKKLSPKQEKIATIASTTAIGDLDALRTELVAGLEAGLTVNEIKEILVQMYAYCGFPRSLQGINTFMTVLDGRKARGVTDTEGESGKMITGEEKYQQGKNTLEQLTGRHETEPVGANAFVPAIDVFLKEHLFADIFGRGVLSYADRELATVSALTVLGGVEPMLQAHKGMALHVGITQEQLEEITTIVTPFVETGIHAIFPKGQQAAAENFKGTAWVKMLADKENYSVGDVYFEPGCRNSWHYHPVGQVLLVTDGEGWYQEKGKPAQLIKKGDVIDIPADVVHWHGATRNSHLIHIAITDNSADGAAVWLEPVADEEYNSL